MVEFREDTAIYPIIVELAGCLCNEIEASGLPTPCSCGPIVGDLVLDYCSACADGKCGGQAWVRLLSAFPSDLLPNASAGATNCNLPLAFQVEVGIVRCKPMGKSGGPRGYSPPTLDEQLSALRLQTADIAAMRRAILCCLGDNEELEVVLGAYTPVTPDGDCVGGLFTVTIRGL